MTSFKEWWESVELSGLFECAARSAWNASRDAILKDELGVYNEGRKDAIKDLQTFIADPMNYDGWTVENIIKAFIEKEG